MTLIRPSIEENFACIPPTIARLFGSKTERRPLPAELLGPTSESFVHVALIFVDAFGWRFLKHYTENDPIPELVRMAGAGKASLITSQFPSTTAAHVTTIHTGLPVWESGICEWHYYESRIDRVITPLPFTTPFDNRPGSLSACGITADQFIARGWFYDELTSLGVNPVVIQKRDYRRSPYNLVTTAGAATLTFGNHDEGLSLLADLLSQARQPTYASYYFEDFDSQMHLDGPLSARSTQIIKQFFRAFEEKVLEPVMSAGQKVLFLFTADHGMTHMNPRSTLYLEQIAPEVEGWLRSTQSGQKIFPCGSSRDLFLHLKPEYVGRAHALLASKLAGVAEVFKMEDLVRRKYFGAESPAPVFLRNIGDLVIAPYPGESVFWLGENEIFKQTFRGHHGGLSADEMQTFFLAYNCGKSGRA